MHALSQLSYGPKASNCSREIEILGPIHAESLIVQSWCEPELKGSSPVYPGDRDEVTAVDVTTVSGDRVDFTLRIRTRVEATRRSAPRAARDHDNTPTKNRPLTLDANETWAQVENEVVPLAIAQ